MDKRTDKLKDKLLESSQRPQVIRDCVALIDAEVKKKSGLTGMAIKGAYAVVKRIKPQLIDEAVDRLLDECVEKLEPFYERFAASGQPQLPTYFQAQAPQIADALLRITDARAERTDNRTLQTTYERLRPTAAKHVEAAVPGIAEILNKHLEHLPPPVL